MYCLSNIIGITSIIITVIYCTGLLIFLSDFEEDSCEMTYMFEHPQFVKISIDEDELFSRYGLYAYSEGKFVNKIRNMHFSGIPVLFIPGNAGSYKQVRSLASVALRKAINNEDHHFDYFTVDLNGEFSGLYGPLLNDQLKYIKMSLNQILTLYMKGNIELKSFIIIGHSMGGVLAEKLILESEKKMFFVLITLASPLQRPPLIFDYHMHRFYENRYAANNCSLIISISGGYSDFLIPPYLSYTKEYNSFHVVTSHIPRSWIEVNHVQIVWCKQIVLTINRALFDSIDHRTKQISQNITYLNAIFRHHFMEHNTIHPRKSYSYSKTEAIHYQGVWIESLLRQYSVDLMHGLNETHWYLIKLTSLPAHQMLAVLAINLKNYNWAFACNAHLPKGGSKVCTEALHLSNSSELLPSIKYKRTYLQINMHELRKKYSDLTHVAIRLLPNYKPVSLHFDIYSNAERKIIIELPSWWNWKKYLILEETSRRAIYYELVIPQLQQVLQFYQLFLKPLKCLVPLHHASVAFIVPWGNQNRHYRFTSDEDNPINIRLYLSKPLSKSTISPTIRLSLDPSCTYQISIKSYLPGMLGQIARFYTPLLLTNISIVVLMALRYQIHGLKNGNCPISLSAVIEGAKPYYILPIGKLLSTLISNLQLFFSGTPNLDCFYLTEYGTDFLFLHVFLFISSISIVLLLNAVFLISLLMMDSFIYKLTHKVSQCLFYNFSDYTVIVLNKIPLVAAGILVLLSISTCGGMAVSLGLLFYFLKLSYMSEEYVEKLISLHLKRIAEKCKNFITKEKHESDARQCKTIYVNANSIGNISEDTTKDTSELITAYNTISFHTILFFIWCIIAIINLPATLTWAHNFKFSSSLSPDTSFIPGFTLSICAYPLWQSDLPKMYRKWSNGMEILIAGITLLILLYATISIYRLNYLLTLIIVLVTFHQLLAPKYININHSDDSKEHHCIYENVKLKLQ